MVGRTVATVAEVCFVVQWAIVLRQLGRCGSGYHLNVAWMIVPLILIAEGFSWHAVITSNYLCNAIENSIWAVAFMLIAVGFAACFRRFDGLVRVVIASRSSGLRAIWRSSSLSTCRCI